MFHKRMEAEKGLDVVLDDHDRAALHAMRWDVSRNGFQGFLIGAASGYLLFEVAQRTKFVTDQIKLLPKHKIATPLVTGAFGSMLASMVTARNNVHTVHYIMHKYGQPQKHTEYQEQMWEAKMKHREEETSLMQGEKGNHDADATSTSHNDYDHEWHSTIAQETGNQATRQV